MKRPNDTSHLNTAERPVDLRAWSKCEYHLLKLLTSGPFLPTKKQICRPGLRGPFSTTAMRKAVSRLRQERWIQRYSIEVHAPYLLERPLLTWQPGQACPDFHELKAKRKRQDETPFVWQSLRVYLPSRQAANLFGTPYLGIETTETHAYRISISQIVSLIDVQTVRASAQWIWDTQGNHRPHERILGSFYKASDGSARAIGIIRAQSCKTLECLHAHSSERGWPIELW